MRHAIHKHLLPHVHPPHLKECPGDADGVVMDGEGQGLSLLLGVHNDLGRAAEKQGQGGDRNGDNGRPSTLLYFTYICSHSCFPVSKPHQIITPGTPEINTHYTFLSTPLPLHGGGTPAQQPHTHFC